MPMYLFEGANYPTYVPGFGYGMDRQAATCIYQEAMKLPYLFIEDVFVNGFARQECDGVRIAHTKLFIPWRMETTSEKEVAPLTYINRQFIISGYPLQAVIHDIPPTDQKKVQERVMRMLQ